MSKKEQGRLHIRLPVELAVNIKDYADRHGTSVSELIRRHFVDLLNQESWKVQEQEQDAEQI